MYTQGRASFFLIIVLDPTSGDPMIVTWLASFARCPPPIPAYSPICLLASRLVIAIPCLAFLLILFN